MNFVINYIHFLYEKELFATGIKTIECGCWWFCRRPGGDWRPQKKLWDRKYWFGRALLGTSRPHKDGEAVLQEFQNNGIQIGPNRWRSQFIEQLTYNSADVSNC